jgi:hypothetical protein
VKHSEEMLTVQVKYASARACSNGRVGFLCTNASETKRKKVGGTKHKKVGGTKRKAAGADRVDVDADVCADGIKEDTKTDETNYDIIVLLLAFPLGVKAYVWDTSNPKPSTYLNAQFLIKFNTLDEIHPALVDAGFHCFEMDERPDLLERISGGEFGCQTFRPVVDGMSAGAQNTWLEDVAIGHLDGLYNFACSGYADESGKRNRYGPYDANLIENGKHFKAEFKAFDLHWNGTCWLLRVANFKPWENDRAFLCARLMHVDGAKSAIAMFEYACMRFANGDIDIASSRGMGTSGQTTATRGLMIQLCAHRGSTDTPQSMWVSFCSIAQQNAGAGVQQSIAKVAPLLGITQAWSDEAFARETLLAPRHQAKRVRL